MPEDIMLQEAVEAIRQGQRGRARDLLTRLLRADASNTQYWLWMSSVVETPKEQIYCLQSILKVDPKNKAARQGLVLLGALPPESEIKPVLPVRRRWHVEVQEVKDVSALRAIWANPFVRLDRPGGDSFRGDRLDWPGLLLPGSAPQTDRSRDPHQHPGTLAHLHLHTHFDQRDAARGYGTTHPFRSAAVGGAPASHLHRHTGLRQDPSYF